MTDGYSSVSRVNRNIYSKRDCAVSLLFHDENRIRTVPFRCRIICKGTVQFAEMEEKEVCLKRRTANLFL